MSYDGSRHPREEYEADALMMMRASYRKTFERVCTCTFDSQSKGYHRHLDALGRAYPPIARSAVL